MKEIFSSGTIGRSRGWTQMQARRCFSLREALQRLPIVTASIAMALPGYAAEPEPSSQPSSAPAQETVQSPVSPSADSQPSAATARSATDRLELDTSVVTGNRELPKVLYIVPWKKADLGDLPAQPFNTLLDEVLTPVDRDVFRREVTYYDAVTSGAVATQSTSPDGR